MHRPVWVIIPAAGVGRRMQVDCPKQYLKIHDKTVLEHTIDIFLGKPSIAGIVVVTGAEDEYWSSVEASFQGFPVFHAMGGNERADSVLNGLTFLSERGVPDHTIVLVHDAARPCLSQRDLHLLVMAIDQYADSGAILATPVRDTMKRSHSGEKIASIQHTESRDNLWHALTPQMANLGVLRDALEKGLSEGANITDEASALEYIGLSPRLLEGESSNIKITRPADLALAEFFLQQGLKEEEG
uniref:2-C-methyl-D-erythritol 4-phosphate cytidylyltransferase n=1 Tax=uncultured Thiotrichaceae bacterium TaxID=298394 RepID=A0A6S6ST61_9GAMM|nr:MAG: 2-C-methyl-D-erythritol 4-phosphate cytidylyltransferase (EC [uncultured Thiotrichaceae bacterium]